MTTVSEKTVNQLIAMPVPDAPSSIDACVTGQDNGTVRPSLLERRKSSRQGVPNVTFANRPFDFGMNHGHRLPKTPYPTAPPSARNGILNDSRLRYATESTHSQDSSSENNENDESDEEEIIESVDHRAVRQNHHKVSSVSQQSHELTGTRKAMGDRPSQWSPWGLAGIGFFVLVVAIVAAAGSVRKY